MKLLKLPLVAVLACFAGSTLAGQGDASEPQILINKNIGFNVKGFNYKQSEFPCDIDKVLVESIVKRGERSGLRVRPVGTASEVRNKDIPVLAIDVERLTLGSKEHSYGTRNVGSLPSVSVIAALVDKSLPEGFISAKHSCAILTLQEFTDTSDILDMGAYGVTMCSATHKCLGDLSKDIVEWVGASVQ